MKIMIFFCRGLIWGLFNRHNNFKKNYIFSIYNHTYEVFTIQRHTFHSTPLSFIKYMLNSFLMPLTSSVEIKNSGPCGLLPAGNSKESQGTSLNCGEHEESLLHHARSRNTKHSALCVSMCYCDATSIDHYKNVVT